MINRLLNNAYATAETENRRAFIELLDENPLADVLDIGCGDGSFTLDIGKKIRAAGLYGIEIEDELALLAGKNDIDVCQCDINHALPYEDDRFDVVTSNQVLEHVWGTDVFIREIYRILKPGGYLVISTPNLAIWQNLVCILLGYQLFATGASNEAKLGNPLIPEYKAKTYGGYFDSHLRVFTLRGLTDLLDYHKFRIESVRGGGYIPFPGRLARNLAALDKRHAQFLTVKARKA